MSTGPLRAVLAAIDDGALTAYDLQRRTGLPNETIRTALEQLQRMGRLTAEQVAVGCPPSGCGTCSVTHSCASGIIALSRPRAGSASQAPDA